MEANEIIAKFSPIIAPIGVSLEVEQPHISGERFLMQKGKFVLVGKKDGKRVAVKISDQIDGKEEIRKERKTRETLSSITFAADKLLIPKEIYYKENLGPYTVWIMEFIEQEKVFVEYNLEEQFFMILRAFEAQEAFHATTYEHMHELEKAFEIYDYSKYIETFGKFQINDVGLKDSVMNLLTKNKEILTKYSGYLTHADLAPHNFRISNRQIYMLDLSAVHFGNKYEGWARLLNYMIIHNPELDKILTRYVQENRGVEEYLDLRLMRIYKIGFLIDFYARSLNKTDGDLKMLTQERIDFWSEIMNYLLENKEIPSNFVEEYKNKRDKLRSEEEKKRQREFAAA